MERVRRLSPRLAAAPALLLTLALLAASCAESGERAPISAGVDSPTAPPAPPTPTPSPRATAAPTATSVPTATPTPTPTPLPPLRGLDAELVADGFDQPVVVAAAPGTDTLYVVEREGLIWPVSDGEVAPEPFLDLRSQMTSSSIEQGLLGLAFHPEYEDNGRVFVYWTRESGDSRLAEFTASGPTQLELESMRVILDVEQPAERHNAGMIVFGPSGLLYLALGDGGGGGSTGQDPSTPLGSIVRLDVDGGDPYRIPADNPFDNEIWVYGLRNPWRFSIDPVDGLVYIGDVGQDRFEEINVVGLDGAGTNFGWFEMEGDLCFRGGCSPATYTGPVLDYQHDVGCSVTGGQVYRGAAIPELFGHYLYADWCSGFVRSFRYDDGDVLDEQDWTADLDRVGQVTSFGVDRAGELYTVNWDGQLFRIVADR